MKPSMFRPWETSPKKSSPTSAVHSDSPATSDSGYDTDTKPSADTNASACQSTKTRKLFSPDLVHQMERWYIDNFDHPYPSDEVVRHFARLGDISVAQVKKWMANKRVRSNNTLSFNHTIHPKRLNRLRKELIMSASVTARRHQPYASTPKKMALDLKDSYTRSPVGFPTFGLPSFVPLPFHPKGSFSSPLL